MSDWVVVLPALDEEEAVGPVVAGFLAQGAREVIVVDNGSADATAGRAGAAGARVVAEPRRGYGSAVLAGLDALRKDPPAFVLVADCDGTLDARDVHALLAPLGDARADLVLGRRVRVERGALPFHQRWGNAFVCALLRLFVGARVRDVPPFRASTWALVERLRLREPTYGLPVETVARAARVGARVVEVDVAYARRAGGRSKVAGTLGGTMRAAWAMVRVVARVRREPA